MQVSIFVLYFTRGWTTMINGRRGAHYRFQVDAVEEALRLAQAMRQRGRAALICVQDRFGELRPLDEPAAPSTDLAAPRQLRPAPPVHEGHGKSSGERGIRDAKVLL